MANQFEKRKLKEKIKDAQHMDEVVEMNSEAVDIFLDEENRTWVQVTVMYDLKTGLAKVKEVEAIADSKPVAVHKMQKFFTDKIMLGRKT